MTGAIAFAPLVRADKLRYQPWQFRISDFLVLLVQLQVFFGLTLMVVRPSDVRDGVALAVVVVLVMTAWWMSGVRMLSKARVAAMTLRLIFLGFLIPLGYGLSLVLMAIPAILVIHAGAAVTLVTSGGQAGGGIFALMTVIEVVAILLMIACRRASAWIVESSQNRTLRDRA
jgi:hypothetical protein